MKRKAGLLTGTLSTIYYSVQNGQRLREKNLAQLVNTPDALYRTNVQISELNALNACLAVIRFKQLRGFYLEELPFYDLAFEVGAIEIVGEHEIEEV